MLSHLDVSNQRQTAMKRIALCCGCAGLAFVAMVWFGLLQRMQAAENTLPDHQVHALPTKIQPQLIASYGKLPLSFEANQGQTDARVRFLARGSGYTIFLTDDEAVLILRKSQPGQRRFSKFGFPSRLDPIRQIDPRARRWPSLVDELNSFWPSLIPDLSQLVPEPNAGKGGVAAGPESQPSQVMRMRLEGGNAKGRVVGLDELPGRSNYFIGNDPKKWRTNVPSYAQVKYKDIYPGVDLLYYGNQRQLEYDFVVAPGADPNQIKLSFAGADGMRVDAASGDLVLKLGNDEVRFRKPAVYQPTVAAVSSPPSNFVAAVYDRRRRSESAATGELDGAFVVASNNQVAFRVAAYDPQRALVIDPVLSYSTFLGGSNVYQQGSNAIAVDSAGDAYVTGNTIATDFPTTAGAVQPTCGGNGTDCMDVFVTKLDPTGSALAYSTYLGGTYVAGGSWNIGLGIAVDTYGNAYVTGWTGDSDFPTTAGAFQPSIGSDDAAFVTKLNPTGSALVYSTYLGGYGFEQGSGIAVDGAGNAYVAGRTGSPDFPTTAGAFQTTYPAGSQLAFITKLNAAGSALVYSTFLGNSNSGGYGANAIAVDSSGNAYVTGTTYSTDFPTVNPIQGTCNNCSTSTDGSEMYTEGYHWGGPYYTDAFVAKLNAAGSALVYSTYLGGSDFDFGYGIAVDPSGNAYVTGFTYSTDFPTANPLQATNKAAPFNGWWEGGTGFVAELNSAGSALVYSTYLGGSDFDLAAGIAVDSSGNAYVTGVTYSNDFPSVHPFPVNNKGGPKVFVAELNTGGSALVYSTYLGAHGADWGQAIAVDSSGSAYVTGWTQSADFPTVNPFQATLNAGTDAFVTKISLLVSPSPTSLTFSPEIVGSTSAPQTVTVTNIPTANLSISTVTIGGANASDFATNADTCTGATLTPNGSCTVSVTFTPSAVGSRSASITITDNASNSPQTVGLTGTGTDPVAGVSPPSLTFGNQNLGTTSGSQPVTLSNTGNAALTITGIVTSANFGATNNCAGSVAASGTCTITVTFSPTASGPLTGTLTITDNSNGVAGSQQTVGLTGTGTGPAAGVSPPSLTFGNQNPGTTSGSQPVTLSNTGNAALTITSIVTTANFGQTNNCAGSVAASGSCTINVTFSPTAIGSPIGALIIADNATSTPQVISLTGTGVWPVVTSAGSVSFGGTLVGQTSGTQTVTLTNNGSSAATINGISSTGGFSETNNCGTSLAVGASCTITVASDPTSPGSTSGTLTINDSDPGSPHTVVLQGIGLAPDAIVTMAGGGPNNLPALNVGLSGPTSVAFDVNGNYYIVAHGQGRVFKVDTSGNLTVFAGNGSPCSPSTSPCGDGQAATSASLSVPYGVAADGAGNVYIADVGTSRIRRVDATTGTITTVAGNGINCTPNTGNPPCYSGDSQAATSASLSVPYGVAVDQAGNNLYIADSGNNRISQVVIATGTIYAFAGNGTRGYSGDNGPATGASLSCPMGVAVDWMSPGNVYIADTCNYVIREVDTTGTISTVAGGGGFCSASFWAPSMCGDGGLATSASLSHPTGVAVVAGDIYIADDDDSRVRVVSQIIGTNLGVPGAAIQTLVGTFQDSCFGFFPTPPLSQGMHSNCAGLNSPWGVAVDYFHGGRVFIADTNNNLVRWAPSIRGIPFPFLPGEDGTAAPGGLPWIMITAGNGTPAYAGDGGPATNASFSSSLGVAVDQAGNIYIPDPGDHCVRQVSAATGIISTVAGNAMAPGYGGDGGPATQASMAAPISVALDGAGNLYIADPGNGVIRKVDATTGNISTVAGNRIRCKSPCYSGDGGPAIAAILSNPNGVALDGAGNIYIAGTGDNRVFKVDTKGNIWTLAGNGTPSYSGDTGPAALATLNQPHEVAVDQTGNVYIADTGNQRIRMIDTDAKIWALAGNGTPGYSGDGVLATATSLYNPLGVAVDGAGNVYIADSANARIREVNTTGTITTVAGNGTPGYSGDGYPATSAMLARPQGVAVDKADGLFIGDNGRIRSVLNTPTGTNIAIPPVDTRTGTSPVTLTFPSITQSGNTSLTTSSTGPTPPSGFMLGTTPPTYYNLTTSATYTGSINICINYSGVTYSDPNDLSIWHYDTTSSTWTQLTTSVDTATTTACASTPSLSPFALFEPSPPAVTLSATSLAFGAQNVGAPSAPQTETVTNAGGAKLTISMVTIGGTNASDFAKSADTCTGATVAPNGACSISVTFTPVGRPGLGAQTGSISITDNAAGSPQSISLSGTGIDTIPPAISISANPSTLWPPNGKSVPVTVSGTITDSGSGVNPGTLACKVVDSYGLVQPACSVGSLGAGGAYSFTVSLVASRDGNDKNGRTYTISVSARDYARNLASVSTTVIVPHDQGN